ncbi:transcriptional regulator [Oceanobacillus picturae]|uniref:Transcriptional regulator n=1 Tax=Oceanobacillus picturae TaxID=171693 RepID=A0A0U9HZQ2_9BACI|nr:TetR/AcrR family transcriptional regulator [Oceanobacillus picturae]GAQ18157.1 transcriptional regulator [Oceanobacillus picturae]
MSPRPGLNKQKLVEAAIELANQGGMEAVTMHALAKKLEVRPPSLYNHIKSLEDLRQQLASVAIFELYNDMEKVAQGKEALEAISAISKAYIAFAHKQPGLYEATLIKSDSSILAVKETGDKIVQLFKKVLAVYHLDEKETIHHIRGLRSILHGFATLEQKSGFGIPININESLEYVLHTYFNGIKQG